MNLFTVLMCRFHWGTKVGINTSKDQLFCLGLWVRKRINTEVKSTYLNSIHVEKTIFSRMRSFIFFISQSPLTGHCPSNAEYGFSPLGVMSLLLLIVCCAYVTGGGGAVAQSVQRATPGEEVPGSIPTVAARSLLVGSVSV